MDLGSKVQSSGFMVWVPGLHQGVDYEATRDDSFGSSNLRKEDAFA